MVPGKKILFPSMKFYFAFFLCLSFFNEVFCEDLTSFIKERPTVSKKSKKFLSCELARSEHAEKLERLTQTKEGIEAEMSVHKKGLDLSKAEGANVFEFEKDSLVSKATPELVQDYAALCRDIYDVVPVNRHEEDPESLAMARRILCKDSFASYHVVRIFFRNRDFLRNPETGGFLYDDNFSPISTKQPSGAILYDPIERHFVIVFAGTVSWDDWMSNFSFFKVDGVDKCGHGLTMHTGFYHQVKDQLENILEGFSRVLGKYGGFWADQKPTRVTVTGHSLGGAMSSILSYHIRKELFPDAQDTVENITFASPRVFTPQSAAIVESVLGKQQILRIWNERDLVPAVPSGSMGFKHVGVDVKISSLKLGYYDLHSMITYCNTLKGQYPAYRKAVELAVKATRLLSNANNELASVNKELAALGPMKRSCRHVIKSKMKAVETDLLNEQVLVQLLEDESDMREKYIGLVKKALDSIKGFKAKVPAGPLGKGYKRVWQAFAGKPQKEKFVW